MIDSDAREKLESEILETADILARHATAVGLSEAQLVSLSELVPLLLASPGRTVAALVKVLPKKVMIPRKYMPFDAVVNWVGPLQQTVLLDDDKAREAILKWNAAVLPLINPQHAMRSLYQLYFRFVVASSNPHLRISAAQILFRITRKADVTSSRVKTLIRLRDSLSSTSSVPAAANATPVTPATQMLVALSERTPILSLLNLYKDYRPDLVQAEVSGSSSALSGAASGPVTPRNTSTPATPVPGGLTSPTGSTPQPAAAREKAPRVALLLQCPAPAWWRLVYRIATQAATEEPADTFPAEIPVGLPSQTRGAGRLAHRGAQSRYSHHRGGTSASECASQSCRTLIVRVGSGAHTAAGAGTRAPPPCTFLGLTFPSLSNSCDSWVVPSSPV